MIAVSAAVRAVIDSGAYEYDVRASSWLGDQLLADRVPIAGGSLETDLSLNVPERVVLQLPRESGGIVWEPRDDYDPLAANGQTLKISIGIGIGIDGFEWFQIGEYLILSTEPADRSTLRVTCVGLLHLVQEAGFVSPFQPSGTLASTLRKLIEPAVLANLDAAPADRAVPAAVNFDADRLSALYSLLDAWPAVPRMNPQGYLDVVGDVTPTVAVRSFTDGEGGTMVQAAGQSGRDGAYNVVVASGTTTSGAEVRGIAYVTTGPWAYPDGPANPLPVPFQYSSPLLTTLAQANAAAATIRNRKMREGVLRRFTITAIPDPTLQDGDAITVTNDQVTDLLCTIEARGLPLRPGSMQLTAVSTT